MNQARNFADLFAAETTNPSASTSDDTWKVLLVDDEPDMHAVLRLAAQDIRVDGRGLQLLDAASAVEAKDRLTKHPDIALVLLDAVMETERAGLDLVHYVRRELGNRMVQIILVTGQPGHAPQREIVSHFEIDGYYLKSELTADRIFVTICAALRTYKAFTDLGRQQTFLRGIIETIPDLIWLKDRDGIYLACNGRFESFFGTTKENIVGKDDHSFLSPESVEFFRARDRAAVAKRGPITNEEWITFASDGHRELLETTKTPMFDDQGRLVGVLGIGRDITDRERTEEQLRLAASVFAHAYDGVIITNADNLIVDCNPASTRVTGYSRDELIGKSPKLLSSGRQGTEFYAGMWKSLQEHDFWQGEVWNRRKSGEVYAEMLSISIVRDATGNLQHHIAVFTDISQLKAHEAELDRIAHYDALTGVPNRRLLADRLEHAMNRARRSGKSLAVFYLDLDGFKPVNDQHGHEAGDQVLVTVANRIKEVLRADDTLARLGGDEFVLILTDIARAEEIHVILDRVLAAVEEPILIDEASICITASIGVTLYPDDSSDPDILLRHADQAMYLAKDGGKHRYQFFDPERDRQVQSHRDQLLRLDQALDRREFTLRYQPKVDLISGEVIGAEALIRWQHPDRGLLAPAEFLQYMEGTELEVSVGEWVIDSVLRQITDWKSSGLAFTVSANVSAHHVLQPDFSERLRLIMQRHPQVASGDLELEIVETAALANMTQAIRALTQCRQLGVHIALDDFGTGYSSLTYFRNLPVDMLKIDQSFVRDMLDDPDALGIVESVVRLARAFNRPVIAEGVETLEHGAMLVQLGCRFAQGHGIARPMPAEQIGAWVKQWSRQAGWRNLDCTVMVAENTTLMIAARSHRIWTDKMVELISRPQSEVPDFVDSEYCQFGRWYRGSGAAQYGEYPEYRAIAPLHDAAHATASELITLAGGSKPEIARDRVSELHAAHDRLLAQIEALSERLATDARESKPGPHAGS